MRIKEINDERILFDNGNEITFSHDSDCCELNIADFEQLDDIARDYNFNEELVFEKERYGFRFGNDNGLKFFVPCYSYQNGYYTTAVDIYYNRKLVCETYGEMEGEAY